MLQRVSNPVLSRFEAIKAGGQWTAVPAMPEASPSIGQERLQLVTTISGFRALEADWNALFERAGRSEQMFQTFNWLWHWTNHFLPADTRALAIVTIYRDGRLVGVLPLILESVVGLKQLAFMGAPVSQYGDALIEDDANATQILKRGVTFAMAVTGADLLRLAKVRDDAAIAPVLAGVAALVTGVEEAPYIDLAAAKTFADYEMRFSSKARKNRRRLERRLEDRGPVDIQWDLKGGAAAEASNTTLVLKRAWLKSRGQLSKALADPRVDAFFADVCSGDSRPVGAHVALLRSGGEIANAAISVSVKGRQALHILAYGLKFEKCAAGILHVEKLIAHAFASGAQTFDFLAPRHDYKLEWADGAMRVADYALPATTAGKIYTHAYLGFVREHLKAALKSAPHLLRAPLSVAQRVARLVRH